MSKHRAVRFILGVLFCLSCGLGLRAERIMTTDTLPFRSIPDYPERATPGAVVARMIDGLGFRLYWATEGLRPEDLDYRPTPESRSILETLRHIAALCEAVRNVGANRPSVRPLNDPEDLASLRGLALNRLADARAHFVRLAKPAELEALEVAFQSPDGTPRGEANFWHLLNGPLADALWHTGQIVAFRRANGNPLPPGVSVFRGIRLEGP